MSLEIPLDTIEILMEFYEVANTCLDFDISVKLDGFIGKYDLPLYRMSLDKLKF